MDESSEVDARPPIPDMVYPLDGSTRLIIPGSVREEAPEVLFHQVRTRVLYFYY